MKVLGCLAIIAIVIALNFFFARVFELLWNWVIPHVFHGPMLTYWEAFGLMLLLSFIGGFFKSSSKS